MKDYVWGGRNLEALFHRPLPPGKIAESWEIAAHPAGTTVVANGIYAGLPLHELHAQLGQALTGRRAGWTERLGRFPLLIKLLDAQERLSVQVHPDDTYAQAHEGNELGKSEMWVVLHATPGAAVVLGVKAGTTPDAFRQAITQDSLEPYLHHLPVRPGDFICVPSGSLHAILGGLVLAEIQQNSNATYRVYDWGRHNPNRLLHLDQALAVTNFNQVEPSLPQAVALSAPAGVRRERLCQNPYFVVERLEMAAGSAFSGHCNGETLEIWGVIAGKASTSGGAETVELPAVTFTLLPAALGPFTVSAQENSTLLCTYLGFPQNSPF
ncbi:MAG: class I mannose-6-phosphate isomerase [Chloroflexi bacterium]|nr:class I mannose-6-phosphate isomerase [Chloroflexota bacterium]MCI0580212.1 class I mannose-6-phosphate isomerase [Chloroflexota bacterium]MCI0646937.1 class I mannose-6-phosphate isomerase [Chloroflexota bacterium]MCI0728692.1 class I mannose-6-phosphate isomerase [Chloroflexota bacterium]